MTVGTHTVGTVSPSGVSAGRNLVTNPSLETNATGYSAARGTVVRAAIPHPISGLWGGTYTSNAATASNYAVFGYAAVVAGHTYTCSAFVEPFGPGVGDTWRVWVQWCDASNALVADVFGPWMPCPPGVMTRIWFTPPPAPAGATQCKVIMAANKSQIPVGSGWHFDALACTESPEPLPYFDGSTPNTALFHYGWTGTAHASASIRNRYVAADLSCLVDQVSIHHGRDDSNSQPEASSCTVDFTATPTDPLPAGVDVGSTVAVETTTDRGTVARFVGRITDMALGWDDAGEYTPDAGVGQLVAVGVLADLGRRVVGDVPWPQELDGARVTRIMSAAGITLDATYSDPGTVQLLPRDVDSKDALAVAHDAATSASGMVWTTRDGKVRYADADHRRGIPSALALDACDVLVTPTWRRTLEGLVNSVSVGYGSTPDGGEQPRFVESDAASMTKWGTYAYTSATDLAALADAQAMGRLLLARNNAPVWIMAALPVDTEGLDATRYAALLGLDVHSLLALTGLPAIGTAPTSANLWVEGYREELTFGGHTMELVVSGYCRTVPPPRWDDVDPGWAWDAVDPALTWDAAACLGPPINVGRWNDQPATLRWNQLPPATTWDNYPTTGG